MVLVNRLAVLFSFVLFGFDIHEFTRCSIEVSLHLLQITTLLKQCFTNSTALVFKDLFAFEISTLCTLHKLVAVVLVSCFKMEQRGSHGFDFFLTFLIFGIKFVTITLELFSFLSGFDYIVNLGVLAWSVSLSCWRLVLLNESFVFDPKILDLTLTLLEFNGNFVAFLFGWLQFRNKDILMNLDFLLTFFHWHLQLILSVFESIYLISFTVHYIPQPFDI